MARLPDVAREQLKPDEQAYFDAIADTGGGMTIEKGPYGILLHSPRLAALISAVGGYVRRETALADSLREVVILATARQIESQYEFAIHAPWAREAGVSDETISAIAQGTAPQGLSGDEELLVRYTQELLRDRKISDTTFNGVKDRFGVRMTVDLTGLIGFYILVGNVLAAFDAEPTPAVTWE